jgi:AraC-like DNA-binding protein
MKEEIILYDKVQDLYNKIGIPIDQSTEFTIHELSAIHQNLPYQSPVFRTNYYSFVFVKDGKGNYTTDNQTFPTEPGTIYFTNPGHIKAFKMEALEEVYLITMSEAFLKEQVHVDIFEEFPFLLAETVPPKVLSPEEFAAFEHLYLQIYKEYNQSSLYKYRIIGNLFVVLLLKIKEQFWANYNPIEEGDRHSEIVKNFKQLLEHHYRQLADGSQDVLFQVQDYANALYLHPNYLSNVIKNKTGKSVNTWIAEKTVTEAQALLRNSKMTIKEIAFQLGFKEPTNFSNYFKRITGIPPGKYRKQEQD